MDLLMPRTRSRASTIDIAMPKPEHEPRMYTVERVTSGIQYATQRLKSATRKVSPATEKVLGFYLTACNEYKAQYETLSEDKRTKLRQEIREYEKAMSEKQWLRPAVTDDEQSARDDVLTFRQMAFFGRYGDYAARLSHRCRQIAVKKQLQFWENISGQHRWTEIRTNLKKDMRQFESSTQFNKGPLPTYTAVLLASEELGLDEDACRRAIYFYADRNAAVHTEMQTLIEKQDIVGLATMLYEDWKDLPKVLPAEYQENQMEFFAIIKHLIDDWFVTSLDVGEISGIDVCHSPHLWGATTRLRVMMIKNHPDAKEKAREQHAQNVAQGAGRLLEKVMEEQKLKDQSRNPPTPSRLPSPGPIPKKISKRQASGNPDRKPLFNKICRLQEGATTAQKTADHETRRAISLQLEANRYSREHREQFGSSPPPPSSPRPSSPPLLLDPLPTSSPLPLSDPPWRSSPPPLSKSPSSSSQSPPSSLSTTDSA